MSYIGNEPIVSATRTVTEVTATAGQTVFNANGGYTVGYLDVFLNGSKLTTTDFTATDGSSITLTEAAQAGDIVRLEALGTFLTSSGLTANNPSYTGTLTGGTGVVNIGSGQVYKDASGNVGIGTSSPAYKLHASGTGAIGIIAQSTSASGATMSMYGSDGAQGFIGTLSNHVLTLATNGTEKARIDTSGNLLVGTTSRLRTNNSSINVICGVGDDVLVGRNPSATSGRFWRHAIDASNTVYVINQDTTGVYMANGATAWTGISDERLKTDLVDITNASEKVSTLRAVTGRYKTDDEGTSRSFLIAQDVQAVLPEAVDSTNPDAIGLRYTEVIPLLVAAIKEQQAIIQSQADTITAMEVRLTALENK